MFAGYLEMKSFLILSLLAMSSSSPPQPQNMLEKPFTSWGFNKMLRGCKEFLIRLVRRKICVLQGDYFTAPLKLTSMGKVLKCQNWHPQSVVRTCN